MNADKVKTFEFTEKIARQYAINQAVSRGKRLLFPKKESSLIRIA